MSDKPIVCEHGSLKRSCIVCGLLEELDEANTEIARLQEQLAILDLPSGVYPALRQVFWNGETRWLVVTDGCHALSSSGCATRWDQAASFPTASIALAVLMAWKEATPC